MNQYSVEIKVVYLPSKELRTYTGMYTLKEIYQILKKYEKDKDFYLFGIDFGATPLFDNELWK